MKIATGILGIIIGLLVLLQSCAVATTAGLIDNKDVSEAGAIGLVVAILYFVGGAFAFGLPLVSVFVFALAALLAVAVSGEFGDMSVWAGIAVVLAAMAFFGWRSSRGKVKAEQVKP